MINIIIGDVTLKRALIYTSVFIFLFVINSTVFAKDRILLLEDVNTKNFVNKVTYISLSNIKKICSYDYCDYVNANDFNNNLDNYTKKYIATISDVETQKTILVKGIKITKIILYD